MHPKYHYPISRIDFERVPINIRDLVEEQFTEPRAVFTFYTLEETPILAIGKGHVELIERRDVNIDTNNYDNIIRVRLEDGIITEYNHIEPKVSVGDKAELGTILAIQDPNFVRGSRALHFHFGFYRKEGDIYAPFKVQLTRPQDI